jgi:predicted acyltransferase (DUF342 family)
MYSPSKKFTTQRFVEKASVIHNNKYNYSKSIYVRNDLKVIITCNIHGDFYQTANGHLQGHGCRKCSVEKSINLQRLNINDFIEKANIIHNSELPLPKGMGF